MYFVSSITLRASSARSAAMQGLTELANLCFQPGHARLQRVVGRHRRDLLGLPAEQLYVALLFLAGLARQPGDELALDKPVEDSLGVGWRLKLVESVRALLQLAGRLRATEHQDGEQRDLTIREAKRLVEQMPVLHCPAPGAARKAHPAAAGKPLERLADRRLVVLDDRVAIRRLVAGEPKRVQRERIGVRRRPLLLDQAPQHPELDGVRVHRASVSSA